MSDHEIDRLRFIHIQFPPDTTEEQYDKFVLCIGGMAVAHAAVYDTDEPEVTGGVEVEPAHKWRDPVVTRKPE